uniref:B30.2/SPRY domain-containing protein n=1 Tax=Astyanax mexicanus TaxID=7994 RepID=A0A8B9KTG8_ASTMX
MLLTLTYNQALTDTLINVNRTKTQRAASPEPSCVSLKSDQSMQVPLQFSGGGGNSDSWTDRHLAVSPEPSCVSMKSEQSMPEPLHFSSENVPSDPESHLVDPSFQTTSMIYKTLERCQMSRSVVSKENSVKKRNIDHIFKELQQKFISLVKNELNTFKKLLSRDCPACLEGEVEDEDRREGVLEITLHILRSMRQTDLANKLQSKLAPACHHKLKSKLKEKCQRINEGISGHGNSSLLNEIYTELNITEGRVGEVNRGHEVRKIEDASRKMASQERPVKCNDVFKPLPEENQPIKTVLTKGVAGIGKTVSVQKFILDWAEGKANQDVHFIFPLPFRELNLMKEKKLSLVSLLQFFFPETTDLKPRHYKYHKIMFIFDGLDEYRMPLDFQNHESLVDIEEQTSVDVLLTNLIRGNLLPSALLWITSLPAAVSQIPPKYVDLVTEVRGFNDPQKEEYFKKRICDQNLANKVITHIKSSRSLHIMCHIPVFCRIAATVLEIMLSEAESGEIPKTLTKMFARFLVFQIKCKSQKYSGKSDLDFDQTRKSILALGKLAFKQLEKGNLIFYEEDLKESGIDIKEVSVYSGVFTQIFREDNELHLGKVFSFVHLSIQEFLAALYAFIKRKVLNQQTNKHFRISKPPMTNFLNSAVDRALQTEGGQLDLFLRFLLGLSLETNWTPLRGILTPTERSSHSNEETVTYIKKKIKKSICPEEPIRLFHCLNELNDHSLVQEVQKYLCRDGDHHRRASLSSVHCSALAFVLMNSEEELDEFNLSKYDSSERCLPRLLPVVEASKKAVLASCNLGENVCEILGSVLNRENSSLKELDLSNNDLQDSGVKLLSAGLKSSHCKLQILRLSGCMVTKKGCSFLAEALTSNPSHLEELDLTYNNPEISGVKLLSAKLEDPHCKLKTLRAEHGGGIRIKPGLKKYGCDLTLDPNTAHTQLCLTEKNRKVVGGEEQSYPDHPDRFNAYHQVMSRESLTGRCYWETEWSGDVWGADIGLTYKTISRKGLNEDCGFGWNENSWILICFKNRYSVQHNKDITTVASRPPSSRRVGVYVDCPAGTLSFYSVSSDTHTLTHLHTFNTTFTEPLHAAFRVGEGSSLCVCKME